MKKTFLNWSIFYVVMSLFVIGATVHAEETPTEKVEPVSPVSKVKYLKITVESAKLWPVKPSGKCWDICLGKKYKLPARGGDSYDKYFEDKEFAKTCTGTWSPDPLIHIKIGKYGNFTTVSKQNTCAPNFNVSHVFRVEEKSPMTVTVSDSDPGKKDLIGTQQFSTLPPNLMNGGTFKLKSFGQVEELTLKAEVVKKPEMGVACDGTYRIRVVEVEVEGKKANGKSWDMGIGSTTKPDIMVILKIGSESIPGKDQLNKTVKKYISRNVNKAMINNLEGTISIKKGDRVKLTVLDADLLNRKETIGETAGSDICKMINAEGKYVFENFGRVKKVVVLFEKTK